MLIQKIYKEDAAYPRTLLRSKHSPDVLYYYGNLSAVDDCIAVIGKRDVSKEILDIAFQAGKMLASEGCTILNGSAIGCDLTAIEGALSVGGKVIVVMPCGLNKIYPERCNALVPSIIRNGGCIISEYSENISPERYRFVERDKIQAALAKKVFSIYSDLDGGTMHTIKFAKKEEKPIGCFVGDKNTSSEGNAYAIANYGARAIHSRNDLIEFWKEKQEIQLSLFEVS